MTERRGIEVRWGLREDEAYVAELLELNGKPRPLAFEERFIVAVAEPEGELLAALSYRTASKRLLLGFFMPTRGPRRVLWRGLCTLVPSPWRGRRVSGRSTPGRAPTATIRVKLGIVGAGVNGAPMQPSLSGAGMSCRQEVGAGSLPCWASLPYRSSGLFVGEE